MFKFLAVMHFVDNDRGNAGYTSYIMQEDHWPLTRTDLIDIQNRINREHGLNYSCMIINLIPLANEKEDN